MTEIISVQNEAPPTWEPPTEQAGPEQVTVWMTNFSVYDATTGQIKYWGNCTNVELEMRKTMESVIEGQFDGTKYYVKNGEIFNRPLVDLTTVGEAVADGTTEMQLHGVPDGAILRCSGVENFTTEVHYEENNFITLVFATPGEHIFEVEAFPYLIERIVINAT